MTGADRPYAWKECAAPDCRAAFPTQHPTKRLYCSTPCRQRVYYHRRRGQPLPERVGLRAAPATRSCADERCGVLFASVNPARRYCSPACANRHRVRAWYRRQRARAVA